MLKALLKKQLLELNQFYFTDRKTGRQRTSGKTVGMIILFAFIFLTVAGSLFALAMLLAGEFSGTSVEWLYFAIFYLVSIFLGVFGSVFNTYSSLYHAKDNELLLSMPVKPGMVLFTRMVGVGAMSLLYSGIVWIPAIAAYWFNARPTALGVVFQLLLTIVIIAFVAVLTCILGWVVAKIAVKLRKKNIVVVLLTLLILGIYYIVYFRMKDIITSLITNADQIGAALKSWAYPLYQFGLAATGKVIPMLITTGIVAVLFLITYLVLSRCFLKIITTNKGGVKTVYKEQTAVKKSVGRALFNKEINKLLSSTAYLMNSCIGVILLPILTVIAAIYCPVLKEYAGIAESMLNIPEPFAAVIVLAVGMICSMNMISAPSVSLEGKNIWILQSMPVRTWDILKSKLRPHIVINGVVGGLCTLILGIIFDLGVINTILMMLVVEMFIFLSGSFGLMMNLLKPNLTWTNETVAVKQSMAVLFTMLGGWVLTLAAGALWYFSSGIINNTVYLACMTVIYAALTFFVVNWIKKKGCRIFEQL